MKSLLQLAVVTAILVVAYSRGEKVPGDTDTILDGHVKVWPYIDPQEIVDKEVDRWKRIIELSSSASTHPFTLPFAPPHINRVGFIKDVLKPASASFFKSVQIVVAPKSAGKSSGLRLVHNALVKHSDYLPVTLMLSVVSNTSLPDCIRPFTAAIDRAYKKLSNADLACVQSAYTHTCDIIHPVPFYKTGTVSVAQWLGTSSLLSDVGCLTAIGTILVGLVAKCSLPLAAQVFGSWRNILIAIISIVTVLEVFGRILVTTVPVDVPTFMNDSSWFYPMCLLQSIGNCMDVRPVLFLMELSKVSVSCQSDMMDLMKGVKFTGTSYPVIIETSDFAWIYNEVMSGRPTESFTLVTFPELSRNELYEYLNGTYSLLTTEEIGTCRFVANCLDFLGE